MKNTLSGTNLKVPFHSDFRTHSCHKHPLPPPPPTRIIARQLLLCWCFTVLLEFLGHLGHGQLAYSHCSWASLLGSLPVSYCKNWSTLTYSKLGKTAGSPYCWKLLQSLLLKCPSVIDVLIADITEITCSRLQNSKARYSECKPLSFLTRASLRPTKHEENAISILLKV